MEIKIPNKQFDELLNKFNEILSELKEINRKTPELGSAPSCGHGELYGSVKNWIYAHGPDCPCNDCNEGKVV